MSAPAVTNIFANSTVADATQVNQNFTDLINAMTDETRDLVIASLTTSVAQGGTGLLKAGGAFASAAERSVPTNGGSTTISQQKSIHIFDPAALIASHTITLPASPVDDQRVVFLAGEFGITAVTLAASSGQSIETGHGITTLPAGSGVEYVLKSNVWYRTNSSIPSTQAGVSTKTTTYSVTTADKIILADATSAAFTITLFADTTAGQVTITKLDNVFGNAVTITDGGSFSTTLHTIGESVVLATDGSNGWQVVSRTIPQVWTTYSPTITGASSSSTVTFQWSRRGTNILFRGKIILTTVDGNNLSFTPPSGIEFNLASNDIQQMMQSSVKNSNSGTQDPVLLYAASTTLVKFVNQFSGSITPVNGNGICVNGDFLHIYGEAQVSGWNG